MNDEERRQLFDRAIRWRLGEGVFTEDMREPSRWFGGHLAYVGETRSEFRARRERSYRLYRDSISAKGGFPGDVVPRLDDEGNVI